MFGLFLFNGKSDLEFYYFDEEFVKIFLANYVKEVEACKTSSDVATHAALTNIVHQVLSPLVASSSFMHEQLRDGYQYFRCRTGVKVYVVKDGDRSCLCMCSTTKVPLAWRAIKLIRSLSDYYFSISQASIKPERLDIRQSVWTFLQALVRHWHNNRYWSSSLFFEAIEQMYLTTDNHLPLHFVDLLENCILSYNETLKLRISHGLMFVGDKLLTQYTATNTTDLEPASIIVLMLVSSVLFASRDASSERYFYESSHHAFKQRMFLSTRSGTALPCDVYFVKLFERISLVLVRELTGSAAALHLYRVYFALGQAVADFQLREQRANSVPMFSDNSPSVASSSSEDSGLDELVHERRAFVRNLETRIRKLKSLFTCYSSDLRLVSLFRRIERRMTQLKTCSRAQEPRVSAQNNGLQSAGFSEVELLHLEGIQDLLLSCFSSAFLPTHAEEVDYPSLFLPLDAASDETITLQRVAHLAREAVIDYKDFLTVKSSLNYTGLMCAEPGLAYFAFIDRFWNRVISPAKPEVDLKRVRVLICRAWKRLSLPMQSWQSPVVINDRNWTLRYFVWFEDATGKPIAPLRRKALSVDGSSLNGDDDGRIFPGVLTSDYYRRLLRLCFPNSNLDDVHLFELVVLFDTTTVTDTAVFSEQNISRICNQLADRMWDIMRSMHLALKGLI